MSEIALECHVQSIPHLHEKGYFSALWYDELGSVLWSSEKMLYKLKI